MHIDNPEGVNTGRFTPSYLQCVITGCSLFAPEFCGNHLNGDLFRLGDTYIFNANQILMAPDEYAYPRQVTLGDEGTYFNKRYILVFRADQATFNDEAAEYML